jgi:hypothetical protein
LKVLHLDFYRVEPDADLEDIGVSGVLDEVCDGGSVAVVEWPDRLVPVLGGLPRFEPLVLDGDGPETRRWYLGGRPAPGPEWATLWNEAKGDRTC